MGCDIHFFTEARQADGTWKHADPRVLNKYYEPDNGEREYELESVYFGRNYRLFAILANVRNGYGFAGVDTGDALVPIADPRGLPDDVSAAVREESDSWGVDGHSHSYFTLQELLDFNWTQRVCNRGWVNWLTWANFHQSKQLAFRSSEEDQPEGWSGGVSGAGVRAITEGEAMDLYEKVLARAKEIDERVFHSRSPAFEQASRELVGEVGDGKPFGFGCKVFVKAEWGVSYFTPCKDFLGETIPRMMQMARDNGCTPDEFRCVFWFDN